jgi:hypothetical protein
MEWITARPPESGWYWVKLSSGGCEIAYYNSLWGLHVQDQPGYLRWKPGWKHAGPLYPPPFPVEPAAEVIAIKKEGR